jgi:ribosome-binding protein aMBF1 (putative translation factor)
MIDERRTKQQPLRIEDYIAGLTPDEQQEVAAAEVAIDLARLLHHAREHRQLSQAEAASLADMKQQAVSRIERPGANIQLGTLQRYLSALGYTLELTIREPATGDIVDQVQIVSST